MTCKNCQHYEVCGLLKTTSRAFKRKRSEAVLPIKCKHFKGYFQSKVEWMGQGKASITAEQFEKIYNDGDDEEE